MRLRDCVTTTARSSELTSCVYIESGIRDHPRARSLLRRLEGQARIEIEHFGEVFNPRAQNFRLQKRNPALIIAAKPRGRVLAAPPGYGLDGDHHYYFSHMLNCVYDCRYCFLQGMYRSAHQVLFVNYEDFAADIEAVARDHAPQPVWFYSGYDCDSLAFDPMTRFSEFFVPLIERIDNAWMELRTKSTQIRALLAREPVERVVVAFSFSDAVSHARLEHGVPPIARRVDAMARLQDAGWPLGLRLDPVVYHRNYRAAFDALLDDILARIDPARLHSVSLGPFRLTRGHHRRVARLYPDEPLFAQDLVARDGIISYPPEREREMIEYCESRLLERVPADRYQPCTWHD